MSLAYLRPRTQVLVSVLVPVVSIILGLVLVWPSAARLRHANQELESTKETIQQKQRSIAEAEAAAKGRPLALAVAVPDEQEPIVFLRQLAALSVESNVTLAAVRASTPPPPPSSATTSAPPGPAGPSGTTTAASPPSGTPLAGTRPVVPPTVEELTDQVTVEATFADLLSLLVRLEGFERILSVSQCRITSRSTYPRLQATFTLSRFVAKPETTAPVSTSATGGPAGSTGGTRQPSP